MNEKKGIDLTKALSFLLALVAIGMIVGVGFLVPTVRTLKKQATEYEIEQRSFKAVKTIYDEESAKLSEFKKENERILTGLVTPFDAGSFKRTNEKYLSSLDIGKLVNADDDGYAFGDYNVTIGFKTPNNMFLFFDAVETNKNILKIQTPLVMGTEQDGLILANFILRTYNADLKGKKVASKPQSAGGGH
jgi:hypothetical protein